MLARISSASLVQANGCGWSFQLSMNDPMAAVSCLTEVKEPRRMAWRVMTEKKHSPGLPDEIVFSIIQKKVLTPNDFPSLGTLSYALLAFVNRYNCAARPFNWKFTADDLTTLLHRIGQRDQAPASQQADLSRAA